MTIAKRLEKAVLPSPPLPPQRSAKAQRKRWEVLELDELWSFVGRRKRRVWLWLVVERARRRIVGWTLGSRGEAPLRKLWPAFPAHYRRFQPAGVAGNHGFDAVFGAVGAGCVAVVGSVGQYLARLQVVEQGQRLRVVAGLPGGGPQPLPSASVQA